MLGKLLHDSLKSISAGTQTYLDVLLKIDRLTTEWDDYECMHYFNALREWIIAAKNRRTEETISYRDSQSYFL